MKFRTALLATSLLYTAPAWALVDPPTASKNDGHIRSVTYDPYNPVQIYAPPGASLRIELGIDETVLQVVTSDQRTLVPGNEPPAAPQSEGIGSTGPHAPASCDPNLCRVVEGNFIYLKPLRQLDPQPLFVQTQRMGEDGKAQMVPYAFELLTKTPEGAVGASVWAVRFVYPRRVKAAQAAEWQRQRAASQALAVQASAMVHPAAAAPPPDANWRYGYRGSPSVKPDAAWDDGRSTFLRFNGNRRVPNIYNKLPDGHESIPAVSPEPDETGNTLRIAHTETKWFVRDGDEAGCLFDLGPDPDGRTTATVADGSAYTLRHAAP